MLGIVSHLGVIDSIWEAMHRFRANTKAFYRMSYGAWLDFYIGWGVLELVPRENRDCEHDKSGTSACVQAARFACGLQLFPRENNTLSKRGCLSQGPDWETSLWNPRPQEGKRQIVRPEPDLPPTHPK